MEVRFVKEVEVCTVYDGMMVIYSISGVVNLFVCGVVGE